MALALETPLRELPGIGETRSRALERLGLRTVGDLLHHYPRDYEDRTVRSTFRSAPEGEAVCVAAMVAEPPRLSRIRKGLELYANIRPAILFDELSGACPLKEELTEGGFDFVVMRELTGGLYFGDRKTVEENGVKKAIDTLTYDENEIRRIAKWGFDVAMKRNKKVCSVDKANVLDSSRLWRSVVAEVARDYPEVELTNMLVDNCAMQLVRDPKQFDVILTENMFGDILSDEASMVTGSIGMLSSASLGATKLGLYEPSHGSAPDIAGQDIANPIATILSAAMMLRYSFDLEKEADAVEDAVKKVLAEGYRTVDIMDEGKTRVGTTKMGDLIAERIG